MDTSIFLARLLGPYCLIVSLGILLNRKVYSVVIDDFPKNAAVVYIGGVLALLFGLLILGFHNVWVRDWPVIITIVGWMGFFKGVWVIAFPKTLPGVIAHYKRNPSLLTLRLILIFVIGVGLTAVGYGNEFGKESSANFKLQGRPSLNS